MNRLTFAFKMARRCVLAARKANHEAVRLKAQGDLESAAVAREFALMNIGSAKNIKGAARSRGQWVA